jgi:hypothetical protein
VVLSEERQGTAMVEVEVSDEHQIYS